MTKRVHIDQLKPGMYVSGLDKSWWRTPFLFHKRLIRNEEDILRLKQAGVYEVTIDLAHSLNVEELQPQSCYSQQAPRKNEEASTLSQNTPLLLNEQQDSSAYDPRMTSTDETNSSVNVRAANDSLPLTVAALAAELPMARAVRTEARIAVQSIFEGVKTGASIESLAVKHAVGGLLSSILRCPSASLLSMQMGQFDGDLLTHAVDVCVLTLVVGKEQGFSPEQLNILGVGALLHDVGEMRLPRNLLRKFNGYSTQEHSLIKEHPRLGVAVLTQAKEIADESRRIISEHHERANGSGYPTGCMGSALSPLSQLVAIIDTYDALISGRNGQPSLLPTHALGYLYQLSSTGVFDGEQATLAIRALGIYPIGALVELNTGEQGIVIATNPAKALRPTVQVIRPQSKNTSTGQRIVDLAAPLQDEPARVIIRVLDPAAARVNLAHYFGERR